MPRTLFLRIASSVLALTVCACDEQVSTPQPADSPGPVGKADGAECTGEACIIDAYEFEHGKPIGSSATLSEVHLVVDPDRSSVLAFAFPYVDGNYAATVWELGDDEQWETIAQTVDEGPSQRLHYATAWDSARGRLVLFGGLVPGPGLRSYGAAVYDEVWEWSPGEGWTQVPRSGSWPVGRVYHEMAFDERSGQTVLFGGAGVDWDDPDLDDLWSWDGSSWTLLDDGGGPGVRRGAAMAYDPDEERMLVYGGGPGSGVDRSSDLWAWGEDGWTLLAAPEEGTGPGPDRWPTIVYDPRLDAPVVLGERKGYTGQIWTWRGGEWDRLQTKGIRDGSSGPNATEAVVHPTTGKIVVLDSRIAWSARPAGGNLAPRVEIPDRVVATPTHDLAQRLYIWDPEGEDLEIEIIGLPGEARYSPHTDTLYWTAPPLDLVGEYPVTINASDGVRTTTRDIVVALEARAYDFLPVGPVDRQISLSSMRITRTLGGTTRGGYATGSCRLSGINPGIVDVTCGISTPALGRSGSMVHDRQAGLQGSTALAEHGSFWISDGYKSRGVPVFSGQINGSISDDGRVAVSFRWNGYTPSTTSVAVEAGVGQL